MGYLVNMEVKNLTISKENVSKALAAINALHTDQETMKKNGAGGGSWGGGKETVHYSWVGNPPEGGFKSLVDALDEWRYTAMPNDDGSIEVMHFNGEKLGNCEVLWRALEKLVPPGAEIQCRGEDGCQWRWVFKGGKFKEQTSKVVWED
jgi:hypothetical protein